MIDILVIISFLLASLFLGIRTKIGKTEKDYFLGGGNIHWFFLCLSVVATETSALTFLAVPGLAWAGSWSFLQLGLGFLIGRMIVAYSLLPLYLDRGFLTIYEWLKREYGPSVQRSVSYIFQITRILGDGIRLYASALPFGLWLTYLGINERDSFIITLSVLSFVTIIYSTFGGFRSIVIVDSFQLGIYWLGGILALIMLYQNFQNQNEPFIWKNLNIFPENPEFKNPYSWGLGILGGAFLSLATHGTDQMLVQRFLATPSLRDGRKAVIVSGILVIIQFMIFLMIGSLLLYVYPNDGSIEKDKVFTKYLLQYMPPPILGLILCGILASSMSTLSSTLNSLSLSFWIDAKGKDFLPRWKIGLKSLSVFFGFLLFGSSLGVYFLQEDTKKSIVELGLTVASYTSGPILFLFLAHLMRLRFNPKMISLVLILSITTAWILNKVFPVPFTILIPLELIITFVWNAVFLWIGTKQKITE